MPSWSNCSTPTTSPCLGDPAVQYHDLDGPPYPQCAAVIRPVRARGNQRAHPHGRHLHASAWPSHAPIPTGQQLEPLHAACSRLVPTDQLKKSRTHSGALNRPDQPLPRATWRDTGTGRRHSGGHATVILGARPRACQRMIDRRDLVEKRIFVGLVEVNAFRDDGSPPRNAGRIVHDDNGTGLRSAPRDRSNQKRRNLSVQGFVVAQSEEGERTRRRALRGQGANCRVCSMGASQESSCL
jgi:hypothetical protein